MNLQNKNFSNYSPAPLFLRKILTFYQYIVAFALLIRYVLGCDLTFLPGW